jgi:hypothetical protein
MVTKQAMMGCKHKTLAILINNKASQSTAPFYYLSPPKPTLIN